MTVKVSGLSVFSASLSLVMVFAFACGTGRTFVLKHPEAKLAVSSVTVSETTSLVSIPEEGKLAFRRKLEELLYGEASFERGAELNIQYYFVQYDPGNQLTRSLLGGIGKVGEGSLVVAAKFFDARNNELGSIRVEGKIDMGFLGGDFRYAIEKAAEEVVEYTILNFR
jgi:hypothetical protein